MIVFSVLGPLEDLMRSVLEFLGPDKLGLPWAWAIVALTIIVRILLVPLMVKQIHSMMHMQAHMPEMKEIQRRYKQDKQRQQQELMRFYKENEINPMASCLPILAQLPVMTALFFVLRNFSKHPPCDLPVAAACIDRGDFSWLGTGFLPNIAVQADAHWSGWVLIVVYVLSQIASTYFMSTSTSSQQRYMMMGLPVFFVWFVMRFPTGLVLYWMTSNVWVVGQGLVTRRLVPKRPPPAKRSSRTPAAGQTHPQRGEAPRPAQPPRRVKRKKGGRR